MAFRRNSIEPGLDIGEGGGEAGLPGMQTRDLRLLKTLKTATVALTPLAIW
jgi:hypothetical protein